MAIPKRSILFETLIKINENETTNDYQQRVCKELEKLFKQNANLDINKFDTRLPYTPLQFCSYHNYIILSEFILWNGAKINIQNYNGNSAAHIAWVNSSIDSIEHLVLYGIDIGLKNKINKTVIDELTAENNIPRIDNYFELIYRKKVYLLNLLNNTYKIKVWSLKRILINFIREEGLHKSENGDYRSMLPILFKHNPLLKEFKKYKKYIKCIDNPKKRKINE